MTVPVALFPALLGAEWAELDASVRDMHGSAEHMRARGQADIEGAGNLPARILRALLGLPAPGLNQPLEVTILRDGTREVWIRDFGHARMCSVLSRAGNHLCERLGPMSFHFELHRVENAVRWDLSRTRLIGIALPRWMCGQVASRSGSRDGRYAFDVDVRMPLIGKLVSYHGWLERAHA